MPTYSFTLTAICEVIVTADTEEEAGLLAADQTPIHEYSFESGECGGVIKDEDMARYAWHADYVID